MRWPHLRDCGESGSSIDILIKTDHLHLLVARESREGKNYESIESRTRLGWIIRGVSNRDAHDLAVRSFIVSSLMKIKEEMRSARVSFVVQVEKTDWSKVQVTSRDIPQLCELDDKFVSLVRQCQEESFAEELHRLSKKKTICSTSSLLSLALILGGD